MFDELAAVDLPGTVFHSLLLARHAEKPTSEADFVVLSSDGLLVVEVKSGGVSLGADGIWRYAGRLGVAHDNEGPFKQANTAMWALRDLLVDRVGSAVIDQLPMGWAVALPQCTFLEHGVEWADAQLYDQRHRGRAGSETWLRAALRHWRERTNKAPAPDVVVDSVRSALRPIFHVVPSLRAQLEETELACERLTEEQVRRLELVEEADRVLVRGGAGTGKTFLALETVRTHSAAGDNVVMIVPSPQLRAFVDARIGDRCRVVAARDRRPDEMAADVLVVDEAQDILDFAGLETMGTWLDGGLEGGRWRIFLDENAQAAVAGRFDHDALELLGGLGATPARLRTNCRNTAQIIEHVNHLLHADIGAPSVATGHGVELRGAANREAAAKLLAAQLKRLRSQGVPASEITVLTSAKPQDSCVPLLPDAVRSTIVPFDEACARTAPAGVTLLASPADFKGLENAVVCLVDVTTLDDERSLADLYVAMTRARVGLWVCVDAGLEDTIDRTMKESIMAERTR